MDEFSQFLTEQDRKARLPNDPEVHRIQRTIEQVVERIIKMAGEKDPRLRGKLLGVGSYYSGLKLNLPDEFDFLVELQSFVEKDDFEVRPAGFRGTRNMWRTPKGYPGLKKILLNTPTRFKSCEEDDHQNERTDWLHKVCGSTRQKSEFVLDPVGVKNSFFDAVTDVIQNNNKLDFGRYLSLDDKEHPTFMYGPSVTLFFVWNGRFYKNLKISVDLTICLKVATWEEHFDFQHYISEKNCLFNEFRNLIRCHGYHLVPYISGRGHFQWKISTSFLETAFFSKFHVNSKLKTIVRIIKHKRDTFLKHRPDPASMKDPLMADCVRFVNFYSGFDYDENYQSLLSSYLIKNAVFDTVCFSSTKDVDRASLSGLYLQVSVILYFTIVKNQARNFFISGLKLNVPPYGDILPGFHKIFTEIEEKYLSKIPDESEDRDKCVPIENSRTGSAFNLSEYTTLDLVRITLDAIKMNHAVLWESDQAHLHIF